MSNLYYTIDISVTPPTDPSFVIFGLFTVDPVTKFLTSFYDTSPESSYGSVSNSQVLALPTDPSYASFNADYQYIDGWSGFSGYGINVNSLTGIPKTSGNVINVWGDFSIDNYGGILFNNGDVNYDVEYIISLVTDTSRNELSGIGYNPVSNINDAYIRNLSAIQVQSITPSALGQFSYLQYSVLTPQQLSVMSKVQINGFTDTQKGSFNSGQLEAIVRQPKKTLWYSMNITPTGTIGSFTPSGSFYGYFSVDSDSYDISGIYDFSEPNTDIKYRRDANINGANFSFRYVNYSGTQNVAGGGVAVIGMPNIVDDIRNFRINTGKPNVSIDAIDFYGSGTNIGLYYQSDNTSWNFYNQGAYSVVYNLLSGNPYRVPCFGENSKILTLNPNTKQEEYTLVQNIRKGTLVKTLRNGFLPVDMIGKSTIKNTSTDERIQTRLYKLSKDKYPELKEDLVLTGCHSVLVDSLSDEEKEATNEHLGQLYVTDRKYRLMTFLDKRAVPLKKEGEFPIYHIALENEDYYMNYGIYANGLAVESCSKRYLKELSNMTLL